MGNNSCCIQNRDDISQSDFDQDYQKIKSVKQYQIQQPQFKQFQTIKHQGQKNLQQKIKLPGGSEYIGQTQHNMPDIPHGYGKQTHPDGDYYIGQFYQGQKNGRGKYYYIDKSTFDGEFRNNLIEGKGTFTWNNGDKYYGQFKNNIINGYGKYYCSQSGLCYEGEYLNGLKHGKGKLLKQDAVILEGTWVKGQFKGFQS